MYHFFLQFHRWLCEPIHNTLLCNDKCACRLKIHSCPGPCVHQNQCIKRNGTLKSNYCVYNSSSKTLHHNVIIFLQYNKGSLPDMMEHGKETHLVYKPFLFLHICLICFSGRYTHLNWKEECNTHFATVVWCGSFAFFSFFPRQFGKEGFSLLHGVSFDPEQKRCSQPASWKSGKTAPSPAAVVAAVTAAIIFINILWTWCSQFKRDTY